MAHKTARTGYQHFVRRINRFPQGAPPSQLLFSILSILMSEREAGLLARLPIRPFTLDTAAKRWKINTQEAKKILDELAGRALLVDMIFQEEPVYVLPPPMAGFFEFSLMRTRGDIDQKLLSELYFQYLNVEEDFVKNLFTHGETQLGRTMVHEPALDHDRDLHVLDYERASHIIETATDRGIGICYCRHKMAHVNRACDAPMEICMTFNSVATALIEHGYARRVDSVEDMALLQQAYDHGLVQFGENVREGVSFICNCCGCCCEAMIAARKFAYLDPVHTTNFIPVVHRESCTGCGACVRACPVEAMRMTSANDPERPKSLVAVVDHDRCLGCGLCVRECSVSAIRLEERDERVLTPVNSAHRVVLMAIERNKIQNLVFDNHLLWSHRALAAVLGVILNLPPLKQALASRQLKSRYLEQLILRMNL